MDMEAKPPCFSTIRIYRKWLESLPKCGANERAATVCRDCLPAYQLRMKKLGRCEHPETMFTIGDDGGVVGVADGDSVGRGRGKPSANTRKKMSESAKARWARTAA